MRTHTSKFIPNPSLFKQQLLIWSQSFREVAFLDSNQHKDSYSKYDCVLAVDAFTSLKTDFPNAFDDLKQYQQTTSDWLFGFLTYDLKNDTEALSSANVDNLQFPDLFFFQPKKLFLLRGNEVEISYLAHCDDELEADFSEIQATEIDFPSNWEQSIEIHQRIDKDRYLEKVRYLLERIHLGDIYEVNFCMEFFANNSAINPIEKFIKLNEISSAPQAVFLKCNRQFLLSASPERYLQKTGDFVISQPIKGTSKRSLDPIEDERSKLDLASHPKERAENIMITDLVRNDLSRTAQKGSVAVEELCGVYSFKQVHQMISTISSRLDPNYTAIDVIKTTFPMGSMTGAPKVSAMKIIEEVEESKRGLYSGAVGYFSPEGDFDFNVVIRSILYNEENRYVSFSVGSAITAQSNPEDEYQECLLKAQAMFKVLQ